jgi:hypothetical protein
MKMLALLLIALLSVPAFAADYSPWRGQTGERFAQGTQKCVPCNGCREEMCCCSMSQQPTCQPGTVTKLPNGNTECSMPQCGCR